MGHQTGRLSGKPFSTTNRSADWSRDAEREGDWVGDLAGGARRSARADATRSTQGGAAPGVDAGLGDGAAEMATEAAADAGRPRWGVPTRMPAGAAARVIELPRPAPEPLEWRPPRTLSQRLLRAVTTPLLLGGAVFVLAVVVTIAVVAFQQPTVPAEFATAEEVPAPDSAGEGLGADAGPVAGTQSGAAAGTVDAPVFVHVVGEVHAPGVVELSSGSRVEAAIEAAGGPTDAAVLAGVNLARVVVDGEQIVVPDAEAAAAGATVGGAHAPGSASAGAAGGIINLNSAGVAELETLPRVGPALAQRIIDWRDMNGPFTSIEQLLQVSGIGAKTLEQFRALVTV